MWNTSNQLIIHTVVIVLYCIFCIGSVRFAVTVDDDVTVVNEDGMKKHISCGTEKGNQKAKNFRTAGLCYIDLAYQSELC